MFRLTRQTRTQIISNLPLVLITFYSSLHLEKAAFFLIALLKEQTVLSVEQAKSTELVVLYGFFSQKGLPRVNSVRNSAKSPFSKYTSLISLLTITLSFLRIDSAIRSATPALLPPPASLSLRSVTTSVVLRGNNTIQRPSSTKGPEITCSLHTYFAKKDLHSGSRSSGGP